MSIFWHAYTDLGGKLNINWYGLIKPILYPTWIWSDLGRKSEGSGNM